jgi:MFS family permease
VVHWLRRFHSFHRSRGSNVETGAPSRYRWVVLFALFLVTMVSQIQWLAHAPIATAAQAYFGFDSVVPINRLAEMYMLVYLVACIPASWVIDRLGTRAGVGFGAAVLGVAGLMKGLYADEYVVVLWSQIALSVAQPFIINAPTAVASQWFPVVERGTAVGIASLAQFVGIILVMIVTPLAIQAGDRTDPALIPVIMRWYGWACLAAAVVCLGLFREGTGARVADATAGVRSFFGGVRHILSLRDVRRTVLLFLVGLGIFNAVTTCIDSICRIKGFDVDQSGLVGAIMLVGGVVGAVVLPLISDRIRRRKAVLAAALLGVVPALAGLALFTDFGVVMAFSFLVGFFVTGAGPVGFQYAAEVGGASTESTSQGLMLLAGQVSGLVFVEAMGDDRMIQGVMWAFVGLSLAAGALALTLKESPMMTSGKTVKAGTSA